MHLDQLGKIHQSSQKTTIFWKLGGWFQFFFNVQPDPSGKDRICQNFFLQSRKGVPQQKILWPTWWIRNSVLLGEVRLAGWQGFSPIFLNEELFRTPESSKSQGRY